MTYKILESHCVFENEKLKEVAVLWDDKGSVRATYTTSNNASGFDNLKPNDIPSPELFQRIASRGMYLDETRKKKYFPGKRKWSR